MQARTTGIAINAHKVIELTSNMWGVSAMKNFDECKIALDELGMTISEWKPVGYIVRVPAWQMTRVFNDIESVLEFVERMQHDFPHGIRKPRTRKIPRTDGNRG